MWAAFGAFGEKFKDEVSLCEGECMAASETASGLVVKKHFFRVKWLRVESVVVNAVEEIVWIYIEFFADVCDKAHVAAVQISVFLYV